MFSDYQQILAKISFVFFDSEKKQKTNRMWFSVALVFLIKNAEIVACILSFRKSRHKPNLENTSKYGFSADFFFFFGGGGGGNGGVLSMHMQVILDSSFARPGSAPIWGGKKGEFNVTIYFRMKARPRV